MLEAIGLITVFYFVFKLVFASNNAHSAPANDLSRRDVVAFIENNIVIVKVSFYGFLFMLLYGLIFIIANVYYSFHENDVVPFDNVGSQCSRRIDIDIHNSNREFNDCLKRMFR